MKITAYVLSSILLCTGSISITYADDAKSKQLLNDALSAAPLSLRNKVTVLDWDKNVLQQGSSNYTCFPTPSNLRGKAPMCLDGPWMEWANAWMSKKPFQAKAIGISYMLAGDEGASNTDPYAKERTADNQWVKEGPHLMIITPDKALLDSLSTDPNNGGPYVMWKGTPYVHIMIPVGGGK